MEDEEMEKKVHQYLQRKGFRVAGLALLEDRTRLSATTTTTTTASSSSHSLSDAALSRSENDPARYYDGYSKLRTWAYSYLDHYKHELLRILYPLFFHCFMDLVAEGHTQEACSFFHTFREDHEHSRDLKKLESILSPLHLEYSYELLLQYLHKTQALVVLGIINERIDFQVSPGQSPLIIDDSDAVVLIGTSKDLTKQINQKEVHWGILEDSLEERMEKAISDSDKTEIESKDADTEDNKARNCFVKRSSEGGKQGGSHKKIKKDKFVGTTGKNMKSETSMVSIAPRVKPELTLPMTSVEVEQSILEDLRNRAQLNSLSLPSVWDMSKIGQPSKAFRLWNTKLNANLVCYKGHNYPVWDVQFSPVGHYFASASHDRTARIWSMDKIQPLRIMAGHLSDVDCVQWHVNCNYIATGSSDKTVRLWDVQTGECIRMFIGHRSMVLSLAMSPDGRYMASGDEDGTIMMWDISSGRCVSPLVGHNSCVWSLAYSCEGALLASGSADCTVKLWDVASSTKTLKMDDTKGGSANRLRMLKALPTKSTPVYTLQFSRRNLLFAAGAPSLGS
uniref:TATA box binding protein-associated factor n=1 Tax=Oryza sativa subsp. japonica TaxID=39947 RepID=Q7XB58_ORYSJ|nr:putative TATA box binding protein-associated factor [Oryza sativa Japonica Group]